MTEAFELESVYDRRVWFLGSVTHPRASRIHIARLRLTLPIPNPTSMTSSPWTATASVCVSARRLLRSQRRGEKPRLSSVVSPLTSPTECCQRDRKLVRAGEFDLSSKVMIAEGRVDFLMARCLSEHQVKGAI